MMVSNSKASNIGKKHVSLCNDTPVLLLTRPGTNRIATRLSHINGIQTGAPDWECDTVVIRIRHTPYGQVNGEIYLEMLSFDIVDVETGIDKAYPNSSIALDEIGARKLMNELSQAFDMGYKIPVQHRNRGDTSYGQKEKKRQNSQTR